MSSSPRKLSIQRPASALAKPSSVLDYQNARQPVALPTPPPSARSTKSASNRSERRRSLPAQAPSSSGSAVSTPIDAYAYALAKQPDELVHLDISGTLYERRRSSGPMSPTMSMSSVQSATSERGYERNSRGDRGRDRDGEQARTRSIASSAEETLSIHRLRSNSGLALHTNSAALRRYTDYNADGSTRLPPTDERFDSDGRFGEETGDGGNRAPGAVAGTPTTPKLLSWETVRAVLDDPVARQRLMEYTRSVGGAENLDFLEMVEQYNKALHSVTALMANISTTYTCMTATEPLNLPQPLSKSLNADVKHVSKSILPGLEMLFGDVNAHIQERVVRNMYPDFVKRQLMFRMKNSLGASSAGAASTPFRFEGLGQAFCLTDPYRPDNPVVYASDSFAKVLGYNRSEDIPRTGRFFRGPEVSNEDAFCEDLVLTRNHRDNRPFWSLVSGCPLKTASGRVRFVLSGLVDVTDAVKTRGDIVSALSAAAPAALQPAPSHGLTMPVHRDVNRPMGTITASHVASGRPPLSKQDKTEKPSSKSFFNPFSRKKRTDTSAAPSARGESAARFNLGSDVVSRSTPPVQSPMTTAAAPQINLSPPATPSLDDTTSMYARFMVLQFVPGSSHGPDYSNPMPPPLPSSSRRNSRYGSSAGVTSALHPSASASVSRLKVAFSSLPMLDLLGLGPAAQEAVMYHDVFAVLSELAGSPSITPVFRANVRQRVVTSESASLELSIPASGVMAPGAVSAGLGAGLASPANASGGGGDESGASTASRRSSLLLSGGRSKRDSMDDEGMSSWDGSRVSDGRWPPSSRRKRSGTYERPGTGSGERRGGGVSAPPRLQRLMSHWTPLKDVDGTVAWVILVMSPVVQ
ncbi:hypothetical protein HMPREF1624_01562 [Sporothrix schenckii ATCC 58251]|uniref:PAS domain-containing protein n=1 Tax=Sporothrix schenckii (strain ATCC 58251 / de Perez 2211183) TaxID=1391915 RepID=U7Q901_SPOS1|nr:hypothetical protein HMPREF1624_01562 [Sporothrix schenckii ATCC 58251]